LVSPPTRPHRLVRFRSRRYGRRGWSARWSLHVGCVASCSFLHGPHLFAGGVDRARPNFASCSCWIGANEPRTGPDRTGPVLVDERESAKEYDGPVDRPSEEFVGVGACQCESRTIRRGNANAHPSRSTALGARPVSGCSLPTCARSSARIGHRAPTVAPLAPRSGPPCTNHITLPLFVPDSRRPINQRSLVTGGTGGTGGGSGEPEADVVRVGRRQVSDAENWMGLDGWVGGKKIRTLFGIDSGRWASCD
jgi:hypothetical protein